MLRALLVGAAVLAGLAAGAPRMAVQAQAPGGPAAAAPPVDMVQYYMVFLRRGPAWTSAVTPETTKVSQAHRANIDRLTREGIMVVAGPFVDQTGARALAGVFILRVGSMEEARNVVETDPAVTAGRFVYEIAPWWGPRSLRY